MATSPVFNEVIGVSFDTQSFMESVQALQDIWKKALEDMSGSSPVVGVSNMDAVSQALSKAADDIKQLGVTYTESLEQISGKLVDTVTNQTGKVESATRATSAAAKKAAIEVVNEFADMANQSEEALERFHDAAAKFLRSGNQPSSLTTNAQSRVFNSLQPSNEEGASALGIEFDQLTAKQKEWYTNYAQTLAQAEDRLREFGKVSVSEEQEEQLNAALAAFERYQQSMVSMADQANAEMLADFRRSLEERVEAGGLTDEELNSLSQQELEVYVDVLSQKQVEQERASELRIAALNKEAQAEERAYQQGLAAFRSYVNSRIAAEEEDTQAIARFTAEQSEIYQQAAMKYAAIWKAAHAENAKRDGSNNEAEDDAAMQRQMQQQVAMQQRANAEMLADFRKSIAAKISAGQLGLDAVARMSAEEEAIYDQEARKFAAVWEQAYAEKARRAKQASQPTEPEENPGFIQSFSSAFSENLSAESLGNLAGLQVAWMAIGAAISLVSTGVSEVVDLFKSGVEYSRQLEDNAAKLQGVIASNVELSKDFAENFKLAGQASTDLQKQFEDASVKYGISVEVLERGFKNFVDGGGASLVSNLREAQQVATLFGVALQAAGKDADTTRAILSELPKMLAGTEKPTSLILETLGLSNKQWDALVAHAKTHHDLLQQLSPLMANYAEVAENAANRQSALTEAIGLETKRIMADAEQPLFKEWTVVLQTVKQFLEENKDRLSAIVQTIVEATEALGKMLGATISLGTQTGSLKDGWHVIYMAVLSVIEGVTTLANGITVVANIISHLGNVKAGQGFKQSWKDATDYAKQQLQEFEDKYNESAKRLYAADTGHKYVAPNQNNFQSYLASQGVYVDNASVTDQNILGGKGTTDLSKTKNSNDALNELKKQYADEAAQSKQQYETDIQQNNTLLAERKKSIQETDAANAAAAQAEYLRQIRIVSTYQDRANALKGVKGPNGQVKDSAVSGFIETLDTKSTELRTQEQKRAADENIQAIKATLTAQDQADQQAIASVRKLTDERVAAAKKAEQLGQTTSRALIASEEVYVNAAKNSTDALYADLISKAGADAERVQQLNAQKAQSDASYTAKLQELSQQRIQLQVKEFSQAQESALRQAQAQRDKIVAANAGGSRSNNPAIANQRSVNATQAELAYAKAVLASAQAQLQEARAAGLVGDALSAKEKAVVSAQAAELTAQARTNEARQKQIDQSPEGSAVNNVVQDLSDTLKGNGDFANTVQNFGEAINTFHSSVNNIVQAIEKGGVLGGIGASASAAGGMASSLAKSFSGAFSSALSMGGPILSAVGTLFSSISSIFEQEAQDIANTIEKNLTNANNAYQDQTATLVQTLAAVQQQRQDAINQLSGVKGGQDQLDKLLPQIDQEIAQLQLQIKEAMVTFTNELQDLNLNNTALSSAFDKWQQINQQVQAYLSAGGNVAAANAYISQSLEAMKQAAGDALNQGYQNAIQDAENLNNLIQQRMQLEQQEAETEFNTVNGDALERRGTKAIDVGTQLQQEKAQYDQQLQNLNSQIDLEQQKVAMESQLYDLAMSTAQLEATSNQLQLEQLQEQLAVLQAQKDIYDGITQGSNGQYGMSQTLMNEIGVVNIIVQAGGTAGDDTAASPNDVADAVTGVLRNWTRYGFGTSLSKT